MNGWPVEAALLAARRWPWSSERIGAGPVQPGSAWIHGASLGEASAARQLARSLAPAFVTTDTAAGRTVADAYRPLDHPLALAARWAEARPRLMLWIESSWWPALSALAARHGVPEVGIGVRATPNVLRRYQHLGGPPMVLARSRADADALSRHTRVLGVTGSFKGDRPGPSPVSFAQPFLVAVSARDGDAEALIHARNTAFPDHALLIAPRHPGPPPATGRPLLRRSHGVTHVPVDHDLWLDTWGELGACLQGAAAAAIGGTHDPVLGGHSPNEARAAGVRFVHGPCTASNAADFVGGICVERADLAAGIRAALAGPPPPPPTPLETSLLERLATPSAETPPRPWLPPLPARRVRRHRVRAWVVAVGSFNARGSGKTSTTAHVARQIVEAGHPVVVLTRGVGRTERGVGDSALHGPDAAWLGDEGAALALQGFRVLAHADRRRALGSWDGVAVLEDGLHANLHADVRVEVVDARFPRARGSLPRGEGRTRIATDLRIAHHHGAFPVPTGALAAERIPTGWSQPFDRCVAFSGIGRPADFFQTVPEAEAHQAFPNHRWHRAARMESLLDWAGDRTLVTTDRDWVRIDTRYRDRVVWRGIRLRIPGFDVQRVLP